MNPGLFGFPPGSNIVVDTQEFDVSGTWYKPKNAVFCILHGTGGGQAGDFGIVGNERGGAAGHAYQVIVLASRLNETEVVIIGSGGRTFSAIGGTTTFAGFSWPGGRNTGDRNSVAYTGGDANSGTLFGGCGVRASGGRHGNFGAGGGGGMGTSGGGGNTGTTGGDGGRPFSFAFTIGSSAPAIGGGPSGGSPGVSGGVLAGNGQNADERHDRFGFGAGGGGGGGGSTGAIGEVRGRGGNGRRGGGGGAAGQYISGSNGNIGFGGNGYLRITTYCWE